MQSSSRQRAHQFGGPELTVLALFLAGLVLFILELDWLENAVAPASMIASAIFVAAVGLYLVARLLSVAGLQSNDRWAAWALLAVGLGTGTVSMASVINRHFAATPRYIAVRVLQKEHQPQRSKSPETWRLLVDLPSSPKWIHVPSDAWLSAADGGTQKLTLCSGYFGVDVVAPVRSHSCAVNGWLRTRL
jgi:hypothetical protein